MTTETQPHLGGSRDFFLSEISTLQCLFAAAQEFDDWDMAQSAVDALVQNAWAAHVQPSGAKPLHCPALPVNDEHDAHILEVD